MLQSLASYIELCLALFYVLSAVAILVVVQVPALRDRFLDYGARAQDLSASKSQEYRAQGWLDLLAGLTVPHRWFFHFYVTSICCSVFWVYQTRYNGHLLKFISDRYTLDPAHSVYEQRVMLCMFFMLAQGSRRLYECSFVLRPSGSRMWIGHYFVGLAFYLTVNIAIWIEAVSATPRERVPRMTEAEVTGTPAEIARTTFCIIAFAGSSLAQSQIHSYLASLPKYTLPDHGLFRALNLIAPHYFFEICIYITFAVLTAREGQLFNRTMLTAVFFVAVNLGITAEGTKKWSRNKFPERRVEILQRKRMIPLIW